MGTQNMAALAVELAKPAYAGLTDAAALVLVEALTITLTNQPIPWPTVETIARTSATGDWSRIVARSRQVPTLPPATATDAAILAAINATESQNTDVLDPTNAPVWAAWQAGFAALEATGDLAATTVAAITALTTQTVLTYPGVTQNDIWVARGQPA